MVNVRFPAFHEGLGAGKIAHPGGHMIVSAKRIVRSNRSYKKKMVSEKEKIESSVCRRAGGDSLCYFELVVSFQVDPQKRQSWYRNEALGSMVVNMQGLMLPQIGHV